MGQFVFNIAKGRVAEFYNKVKTGTNERLVVIAVLSANIEADSVLIDKDTVSQVFSGTTDEATNSGYSRFVVTAAMLSAMGSTPSPDDTNDRMDLDITTDPNWTAVQASPGAWAALIIAYDPDITGGDDTTVIPLTKHDFSVTPDGSDITAQIATAGFYRAS